MSIRRPNVISFIVKIWIDEGDDQDRALTWHGLVSEVPDGEKQYVSELTEISSFIASSLTRLGVRVSRGGPTQS